MSKRDLIIAAAVKVFAEKGFCNSKVRDVAQQAGIADGTIYIYFKSKDDLLISLFETKMDHIYSHFVERLRPLKNPVEKLKVFLETYFNMIREDRELAEVFQVELRQSSKFLKDYHNQKFIDYLNIIGDVINEAKMQGFFRDELNTNFLKVFIFGAIDEMARQWILDREDKLDINLMAREAYDMILKGLVIP